MIYWVMIIALGCALFLVSTCTDSHAWDWDNTDKTMFGISTVLLTMDFMQTNNIYDRDEYYEINPVIDWGVDRIGKKFVPIYFSASLVAKYFIADNLDSKWRKGFLGLCILTSGFLVIHNNSIGLRFSF